MTLTEENAKLLAIENYRAIGCTGEEEFDRDFELARRVAHQLNKIERGDPKANPRLLVNYIVILFNVFRYDFAIELLMLVTEKRNHSRLASLLIATEKVPMNFFEDIPLDLNILNLIRNELR